MLVVVKHSILENSPTYAEHGNKGLATMMMMMTLLLLLLL